MASDQASNGERIIPASVVIAHRAGRVFLVERPVTARFFPGVWAFPGGKVDATDGSGADGFRAAALRELAEETALAVADADRLVPAGRLLTPPFGPVRFDTQFFLLELRDGEEPRVVPGELVQGRFAGPAEAVASYDRGGLALAPPTVAILRIAATQGLHGAAEKMAASDGVPHHRRFRIEVAPGIYTVPLRTRTLPPATTTNAVVYAGERIVVVDPGPPEASEVEHLLVLLRGLEVDGRRVTDVALTHHHADHVGGAVAVADEFHARLSAHAETARRLPLKVDRLLADGDTFDLGTWAPTGAPWRVEALHTPGHAPGHLAFVDRRFTHVAAGDLVSGVSTILVDPEEGDMALYLESLRRLVALGATGVLPAHGPPSAGGGLLARTLDHRLMREKRVLDGLAAGRSDEEALLPFVYDDADPAVWPLAARNLRSHLRKLAREGRVAEDARGWRLA